MEIWDADNHLYEVEDSHTSYLPKRYHGAATAGGMFEERMLADIEQFLGGNLRDLLTGTPYAA